MSYRTPRVGDRVKTLFVIKGKRIGNLPNKQWYDGTIKVFDVDRDVATLAWDSKDPDSDFPLHQKTFGETWEFIDSSMVNESMANLACNGDNGDDSDSDSESSSSSDEEEIVTVKSGKRKAGKHKSRKRKVDRHAELLQMLYQKFEEINKRLEVQEKQSNMQKLQLPSSSPETSISSGEWNFFDIPDGTHGFWTDAMTRAWESFNDKKHYQGVSLLGINDRTDKTKGGHKIMCCYYKNMLNPCVSKKLRSGDNGTKTFFSGPATFVHPKILQSMAFRQLDSTDAQKEAFKYALCSSCKDVYMKNDYSCNIRKKTEECAICKLNGKKKTNKIPLCLSCFHDTPMGITAESPLEKAIKVLSNYFAPFFIDFKYQKSYPVQRKEGNKYVQKFIDMYVTFKCARTNCECFWIIEQDQDQHKSYVAADEKNKLAFESSVVGNREPGTYKVIVIRFNSNSPYYKGDGDTVSNDYTFHERIVILRQWLIWWLYNIDKVRTWYIWYFWYDNKQDIRKNVVLDASFPGTSLIYNAPKPVGDGFSDWMYAMNITEGSHKMYQDMIDRRQNPIEVLSETWCINDEHKSKEIVPPTIKTFLDKMS